MRKWLRFKLYIIRFKTTLTCMSRHCPLSPAANSSELWSNSLRPAMSSTVVCGGSSGWVGSAVPKNTRSHCVTWARGRREKERKEKREFIKIIGWRLNADSLIENNMYRTRKANGNEKRDLMYIIIIR